MEALGKFLRVFCGFRNFAAIFNEVGDRTLTQDIVSRVIGCK